MTKLERSNPDFKIKNVETFIEMKFAKLFINFKPDTVLHVLAFLNSGSQNT